MDLDKILKKIDLQTDPNVLLSLNQADDAGVYMISDNLALIQTVDFITPVVDDPYAFGQIAVANALSDVYAMGGIPKTALNLVMFPSENANIKILEEIIQGGLSKLKEADVVLLGGHSIKDKEIKYGISVTGFINPKKIITKHGIKNGDNLILTKALGTGIINMAIRSGVASNKLINKATKLMTSLNKAAANAINKYQVHACTDITGFGFIGHLAEMIKNSKLSVEINSKKIPIIDEVMDFARMRLIPKNTYKNKNFRKNMVIIENCVENALENILYDPQTSGGLLISIDPKLSNELVNYLKNTGVIDATIIGKITNCLNEKIYIL